ncbi:hypothetical protein EGM70_16195 [Enterobacteriaceae bacterium 89]|nr:hypothetical protein [Enterobacteriaceae bacterium 89]
MKIPISLTLMLLIYSGTSLAWDSQGHQVIGQIADELIKGSHAETEVKKIIGPNGTLAFISGWADCVKSVKLNPGDSSFYYDSKKSFPECDKYENKEEQIKYAVDNWSSCKEYQPSTMPCHARYHFTDVAIQRDEYLSDEYGTSSVDIVKAINAAIAVLKGETPDVPFHIDNKKDALRLLVHLVGDETQPLHVASVYLNEKGEVVDPDKISKQSVLENQGGNKLIDGTATLHSEWDSIQSLELKEDKWRYLLPGAKKITSPEVDIMKWSTVWANDSIGVSKTLFSKLTFSECIKTGKEKGTSCEGNWYIGLGTSNPLQRAKIQEQQLQKGGANLANILKAIYQ